MTLDQAIEALNAIPVYQGPLGPTVDGGAHDRIVQAFKDAGGDVDLLYSERDLRARRR